MAGWSKLANDTALDSADISNEYQVGGFYVESNHIVKDISVADDSNDTDHEVKLRCLFDQVLTVFLNEAASKGCIRPLPALLSNGQSLDLFKLFLIVRKRGGFDLVNGFWTFVVKELGLDRQASASVKLIYFKYLYELERWLAGRLIGGKLRNALGQCSGNFSFLSLDLEREFRSLLSHEYGQKGKVTKIKLSKHKKNGKHIDKDVGKIEKGLFGSNKVHEVFKGVGNRYSNNDEKYCNDDDDDDDDNVLVNLNLSTGKKELNSRKRKRESLSRMLNWVIQIAKCPDDPSVRPIPPQSKWKEYGGEELWIQAIRARNALLQRRWADSNTQQSLLQNNQKMHPSMYEDVCLHGERSADRVRCSERLPASAKARLCSCCNTCSAPQSSLVGPPRRWFENGLKEQAFLADDLSAANGVLSSSGDEHFQRHVSVGPRFQAEVPEWTGKVSESDSKWLGTQVWPLEDEDRNAVDEMDPVGKGRPELCACRLPGSVECVRFHIAERRKKLKDELGKAFYLWKFDQMGEEVSLRCTDAEEKRFKDMVRLNPPSLGKCFWDYADRYFPRKTREELVSYYFNVFVVRRRCYQNRVTPNNIDSDNDDLEFGSVSDSYGHEAVEFPGANMMICLENKQCTDL